jgi:hypothetical protein
LSPRHSARWLILSNNVGRSSSANESHYLDCVITGDETWTFEYDPETKRQSAETEEGEDEQIQSENNAHRLFRREGCGPQRQRIKTALKGRRFESIPAIQAAVTTALNEVPVRPLRGRTGHGRVDGKNA